MKTKEKLAQISEWIEDNVKETVQLSTHNMHIHTYHTLHPQEKAMIVMVHGFCGFFAKYHELYYNFYQNGYSVIMAELRGHGMSQGRLNSPDRRVYVESFDEYVDDLSVTVAFAKEISHTKKLMLYAHSMGGCVSAIYLENHPNDISAAVLSAPMMQMNYGKVPRQAVKLLSVYSWLKKNGKEYAPGQGSFTNEYAFGRSSDDSEDRYAYQFERRSKEAMYQAWGGTWAWANAASKACAYVLQNAKKCVTPVLICQAGNDTMVKNEAHFLFKQLSRNTSIAKYPLSKHEIYGSFDDIVVGYTQDVITFFDKHLA